MFGGQTVSTDIGYHQMLWLAVIAACGAVVVMLAVTRARVRRHALREQGLEEAVLQRTRELDRERLLEQRRNRILEMLVSNHSLGTVLDAVAEMTRAELRGCHCAILLRRPEGCHVASAPGLPATWLKALKIPYAVPFEVWRSPCSFAAVDADPAWRTFTGGLSNIAALSSSAESADPQGVRSVPVGMESSLGAILIFEGAGVDGTSLDGIRAGLDCATPLIEGAARLAQLAIEHSRLYDDLQFRAHHDVLTGLANRALFEEHLESGLHRAKALGGRLAVVLIDLDEFKKINDTMSHRVGDQLLIEMADRMRHAVRPGDTVARLGGDEFSVMIGDVAGVAEAEEVAGRILAAIRRPWAINGQSLVTTASVGIALYPDDGAEGEDLQREADAAMYCAKGLGRDRFQSFGTRNDKLDRARLGQEVRSALREGWFSVHYQPKIGSDGRFGGLEALARLLHPTLGQIPPMEFIPAAEESGLIVPLGAWVLNEVCRQIAEWRKNGFGEICVAVNASPMQIVRPDFAKQVKECMARHDVPASALQLELTESMFIAGGEESQVQMRELRSIGIHFSIDDFGTGYSSLSYLHKLEVDAIKLDRSFVQSIDTDQVARRLVQAMIGVAQGLGLDVVAEGVETEAQRSALITAGCPVMQGYLFSRPLSVKDLEVYLQQNLRTPDSHGRRFEQSAHSAVELCAA